MSKVIVLFFTANPRSHPLVGDMPGLQLGRNVRNVGRRVRAAEHRDALEFAHRPAVTSADVFQALDETQPQVVHFSGHGTLQGLVLLHEDGEPHLVSADALTQLFQASRGKIRLVVLNACHSLPLADEIAKVVGCAIGMRCAITDEAAITFDASFYGAIAFGHSVQVAFDQACAAVAMQHPGEEDCPALAVGPGVDAAALVLVSRSRLRRLRTTILWLALLAAASVAVKVADPPPTWRPQCGWSAGAGWSSTPRVDRVTSGESSAGAHPNLAAAKRMRAAGDYAEALRLFRLAANDGNGEAMGYVGIALLRGEGTRPQPDSGIEWIRKAAGKHDVRALTVLGNAYRYGQGVHPNRMLALYRLREAADRGWPDAMRSLASLYQDEHHYTEAFDLYRKAVEAGSPDAWAEAGWMYEAGLGVRRYPEEAVCLYRTAAAAGSAEGMYELGRSYQQAIGVRRDLDEAMSWYEKASDAGSVEAMIAMGRLYQNGLGVKRDSAAATSWYRRAREAGSKVAAGTLRSMGEK